LTHWQQTYPSEEEFHMCFNHNPSKMISHWEAHPHHPKSRRDVEPHNPNLAAMLPQIQFAAVSEIWLAGHLHRHLGLSFFPDRSCLWYWRRAGSGAKRRVYFGRMASGEWLGSFNSRSLQGGASAFLANSWNKRWSADSLQEKSPKSLQVAAFYSQSTVSSTSPHPIVRITGTFASWCYHTSYRKRSGVGIRGRGWRDVAGEMKSFGSSHRHPFLTAPAPIPGILRRSRQSGSPAFDGVFSI